MFLNKLILILSSSLLFFLNASSASENFDLIRYYNGLTVQERESQSQDVDRSELERMIDLPFYESDDRNAFFVGWRDGDGNAFGIAHFQNSFMSKGFEFLLWFYDHEDGFHVVTRESDLYNENYHEIEFDKILINTNGVVVASFRSQDLNPYWPTNKVSTWLSWSKESGLFLDPKIEFAFYTGNYDSTLYNLNNKDYFLIQGGGNNDFYIINAKNPSEIHSFDFKNFLENPFREKRQKQFKEYSDYHVYYALSLWQCYLDEDGNIIGKTAGKVMYSGIRHGCQPGREPCGSESRREPCGSRIPPPCRPYPKTRLSYDATLDFIIKINGERQVTITGG